MIHKFGVQFIIFCLAIHSAYFTINSEFTDESSGRSRLIKEGYQVISFSGWSPLGVRDVMDFTSSGFYVITPNGKSAKVAVVQNWTGYERIQLIYEAN
jgi:hypothetical protein